VDFANRGGFAPKVAFELKVGDLNRKQLANSFKYRGLLIRKCNLNQKCVTFRTFGAKPTEGAKFWLGVMTELKSRGVSASFIACVDGLKGLPDAIEAGFPQAQAQQCLVHQVQARLSYVG
jgi:hypothetical protein